MRLRGILAAASVFVVAAGAAFWPAGATTGTTVQPAVVTGSGLGFDACIAPSTATLRAWTASPYKSVNIYFGGSQRGCPNQPQLSADWVATVLSNGWSLIPTYVGLQAPSPCYSNSKGTTSAATATSDGTNEADDAVAGLQALGLNATIAYLDLEPFDVSKDPTCNSTVLAYVDAWTQELHAKGFKSGVYVNANHGLVTFTSAYNSDPQRPDDIWVADWNGNPAPDDVTTGQWPHHQLHQYHGGTDETYAGITINIDGDAIDGDVVSAQSVTVTGYNVSAPGTGLKQRTSPNYNSDANVTSTLADGSPLSIACQATGEISNGDNVWDRLNGGQPTYVFDLFTTTTGRNGFSGSIPKCDTTPPTTSMRMLPVATRATTATVSWTAADTPNPNGETSGITTTRLRYRFASFHGGWSAWRYGAFTTSRSARQPLSAGYDYCFEAQAVDLSGNVGPWSPQTCVARALDDPSLYRSRGGWIRRTGSHFYLHTATDIKSGGRSLSRPTFVGDRLGIVATTCHWCGAVRLYVGSHYIGTINLFASRTHYQQVLMLKQFSLRSGTVRLVTTSGKLVQIDGLVTSRT